MVDLWLGLLRDRRRFSSWRASAGRRSGRPAPHAPSAHGSSAAPTAAGDAPAWWTPAPTPDGHDAAATFPAGSVQANAPQPLPGRGGPAPSALGVPTAPVRAQACEGRENGTPFSRLLGQQKQHLQIQPTFLVVRAQAKRNGELQRLTSATAAGTGSASPPIPGRRGFRMWNCRRYQQLSAQQTTLTVSCFLRRALCCPFCANRTGQFQGRAVVFKRICAEDYVTMYVGVNKSRSDESFRFLWSQILQNCLSKSVAVCTS